LTLYYISCICSMCAEELMPTKQLSASVQAAESTCYHAAPVHSS